MDEKIVETKVTTETKTFAVENIAKNIYTTLAGCVLMSVSGFAFMAPWFIVLPVQPPAEWKLIATFFVGFILLFMKDNLKSYIDAYAKKKIDKV